MSSYNLPVGAPRDERYSEFLTGIKHWQVYSQNAEESLLDAIFERIGIENKWCFEGGAADGLFFSNTRLLIDQGWHAVLVEVDAGDALKLMQQFPQTSNDARVKVFHGWMVSRHAESAGGLPQATIDEILTGFDAPKDLDLLVIDVDSQDYYLFNSIVEFKPRVVVVEFDPDAEPMFIPELNGKGQAGHLAMLYVAQARGYEVICRTPTNLICVRKDLAKLLEGEAQFDQERICDLSEASKALDDISEGTKPFGDSRLMYTDNGKRCLQCGHVLMDEQGRSWCNCPIQPRRSADPQIGDLSPMTQAEVNRAMYEDGRRKDNFRPQVFAAGRWQFTDTDAEIEVLAEELEAANADKLPTRMIEAVMTRTRIAAALSMPSLCHTATMLCVYEALQPFGVPLFTGHGCFWHHGLTRSIEKALAWRDKDGNVADFILTIDFDSIFTNETVKALVTTLAQTPEISALVPMQLKREGGELLAFTAGSANLTLPVVPILAGHFGLTLFRREVFAQLPKPWFLEKPSPNGDWNDGRRDPDMTFWDQFVAAGLKAGLATKILVGHKQEMITWPHLKDGQVNGVNQYGQEWQKTKSAPVAVL